MAICPPNCQARAGCELLSAWFARGGQDVRFSVTPVFRNVVRIRHLTTTRAYRGHDQLK